MDGREKRSVLQGGEEVKSAAVGGEVLVLWGEDSDEGCLRRRVEGTSELDDRGAKQRAEP